MNAFLMALTAALPTALIILVEATVVLLAAILVQPLMRRFPAARHAILLLALVTVSLCPAIVIVAHHTDLPALIPAQDSPVQILIHQQGSVAAVTHGVRTAPAHHLPLAAILVLVWMAGALVGVLRMTHSWWRMRRIQGAAQVPSDGRIAQVLDHVATIFRRPAPAVLVSGRVGVPMAGGLRHPVVLLPASMAPRLGDPELLQVVVHECAHVFRRDTLVKVYQRFLAAMLWFHPLIHIANRLLDSAREDLCDNYVLRVASPAEYSGTLLAIAESLVPNPDGLIAPTLVRPAGKLEIRVANLLDTKRCVMTHLKSSSVAVVAAVFAGGVLAMTSLAASPARLGLSNNASLPYVVTPEAGATSHAADAQGDSITIESVRGTSSKLSPGNTYEVHGTYKLVSHSKARLNLWVTAIIHPIRVRDAKGREYRLVPVNLNDSHRPLPDQRMTVSRGSGHFTLRFHLWAAGMPHVSFYPYGGGSSFLGAYFLTPRPGGGHLIDVIHPTK